MMDRFVLMRIDKAVDTAGKGAQYAWPQLVAYTKMTSIINLAMFFALDIVCALVILLCLTKGWDEGCGGPGKREIYHLQEWAAVMLIGAIVVSILAVIGTLVAIGSYVPAIVSPEADLIMKAIK